MPVNETLSQYSDWTFTTAGAIYALALLCYLAEAAFSRSRELVAAGAPAAPGVVQERPLPERLGRVGVAVTVLGLGLHATSILLRGIATGRVPWGNMYEYVSVVCLGAITAWLVLLFRSKSESLRRATGFVLTPILILLFLAGTVLYATAAPVQPALQSYWLVIHVSAAALSSGILLVPGVASMLYLVRARNERDPRKFAWLAARLPSAEVLDRLAYRTTVFAFPVYTFGVICGAIWAESAWGRFWGWDPKETCAFIAWVIYAAYLHARSTAGWRGNGAAVINTIGFAVMIFNLFFINLVTAGLHSYAGLD
jgi:cytochrome c-type biogenesis protein CcsB